MLYFRATVALVLNILYVNVYLKEVMYDDITKGSLLAAEGQDHTHANMACLAVVRGGEAKPQLEVEETIDCLDYLAVAVGACLPMLARGPWHRAGPWIGR